MQPRDDRGAFADGFSPDDYTPHICESNGWQYFWSVQQDIDGLIALTGGKERLRRSLTVCSRTALPMMRAPIFSTGMMGSMRMAMNRAIMLFICSTKWGNPGKPRSMRRR